MSNVVGSCRVQPEVREEQDPVMIPVRFPCECADPATKDLQLTMRWYVLSIDLWDGGVSGRVAHSVDGMLDGRSVPDVDVFDDDLKDCIDWRSK